MCSLTLIDLRAMIGVYVLPMVSFCYLLLLFTTVIYHRCVRAAHGKLLLRCNGLYLRRRYFLVCMHVIYYWYLLLLFTTVIYCYLLLLRCNGLYLRRRYFLVCTSCRMCSLTVRPVECVLLLYVL